MAGTGTLDPFDIDMYAPIACRCTGPRASAPPAFLPANLLRGTVNAHRECGNSPARPLVTRLELGLYTI
ncbi:hypothetical protein Saso_17240 [Streptomyces asoensis]|uniref:Uncharacterized protein n=1 Tax=Streptomyces asoensis TaxID=249586 RepID=A0ABQ3RW22_9ACTN|nr:hypothetical protein GCM10010496_35730 [Streptomyces asoensis]GHI60074.1 hypothetical protein Saso_17240 [Streptomyces asoensis]